MVATLLLALVFAAPSGIHAQASKVPVVPLKPFIEAPLWQLDITWSAKDAYEDAQWSAKLEMTATARFLLKQSEKHDDYGRWHVEHIQAGNIALASYQINKENRSRIDFNGAAGTIDASATLDVGGKTPGYLVDSVASFPITVTTGSGTRNKGVGLNMADIEDSPILTTGPLPSTGQTISGSRVIAMVVLPFGGSLLPKTRVGITFVLTPIYSLEPLTK